MNRKVVIVILRVFVAIWMLVNIGLLITVFSHGGTLVENLKDAFQILISFFCSLLLGFYIWDKNNLLHS